MALTLTDLKEKKKPIVKVMINTGTIFAVEYFNVY